MIRQNLENTKQATFSVELPSSRHQEMPIPTGTGFFVSPDGWFVTAAHVVMQGGTPRSDVASAWLMKEAVAETGQGSAMCQTVRLEYCDPRDDFALLKVDFQSNANKDWLRGRNAFPHIEVSTRRLQEGEPVYSFGYPLGKADVLGSTAVTIGVATLFPRVTSAIVSSCIEQSGMVTVAGPQRNYALDKALNYGNSGGPIVSAETGKVYAFCSLFQPVLVPQPNLVGHQGNQLQVFMPSLYGVVTNLAFPSILTELEARGVPISTT